MPQYLFTHEVVWTDARGEHRVEHTTLWPEEAKHYAEAKAEAEGWEPAKGGSRFVGAVPAPDRQSATL